MSKDKQPERVLGTGAKGDPENPGLNEKQVAEEQKAAEAEADQLLEHTEKTETTVTKNAEKTTTKEDDDA